MRCKCCDKPKARHWKDGWYCAECRALIQKTMKEDYDDHAGRITGYRWSDECDLIHSRWDDET